MSGLSMQDIWCMKCIFLQVVQLSHSFQHLIDIPMLYSEVCFGTDQLTLCHTLCLYLGYQLLKLQLDVSG